MRQQGYLFLFAINISTQLLKKLTCNGKEYGPWIYYRKDGSKAASEIYENGKCISTKHFDESGNETGVNKDRTEHPAEFKGGVNKWKGYLETNLIWPNGYHFTNTNSVVLLVQMTIDEQEI